MQRKPLYTTGGNIHGYEGTTTVENNTKIPQEIKMERPYHAAVTLGGQPQDREGSPRVTYTTTFIYTLFTIGKAQEKEGIHWEEDEMAAGIMLSEISRTEGGQTQPGVTYV